MTIETTTSSSQMQTVEAPVEATEPGTPGAGSPAGPAASHATPVADSAPASPQADAHSAEAQRAEDGADANGSADDAAPAEAAERPSVADLAAAGAGSAESFTPRQVGAARKFGLAADNLAALAELGDKGRSLLDRLVKADSELGRRYSRLGRAEQAAPGAASQKAGADDPEASCVSTGSASRHPRPTAGASSLPGPCPSDEPPVPQGEAAEQAAEMERLRGQVSQLTRAAEESQAAREQAEAERFFARLDPEVYDGFGRGPSQALPEGSPSRQRRQELLGKAAEIRRGRQALRSEELGVEESLAQALAILAPGAAARAQRRELARQVRLRQAGFLARPAQQRGPGALESPADRTARVLEDWQGRKGVRFFEE